MSKKDEFFSAEDAVREDLEDSELTFKEVAYRIFPNKSVDQAVWLLRKKLDADQRSILGLQETIGLLKITETAENTVRYFCAELGYEMPQKKQTPDNDVLIAEEKIKEIDKELGEIHERCQQKISERNELISKINKSRRGI